MTGGAGDELAPGGSGPRFPLSFRGYDATAVDEHVSDLERRLEEVMARSAALEEELLAARRELDAAESRQQAIEDRSGEQLDRMLVSIANVLAAANEEAESVRRRAEAEAEERLAVVDERITLAEKRLHEATTVRDQAEAEARAIIRRAETKATLLEAEALMATAVQRDRVTSGPQEPETSPEPAPPGAAHAGLEHAPRSEPEDRGGDAADESAREGQTSHEAERTDPDGGEEHTRET